jgi:methylmalonyl-CoA/ethylmalonyl-CoA epimerase
MLNGLEHIGIAVENLDMSIELWLRLTGGRLTHREVVSDQRVEVAVIEVGSLRVELLCATADDSPIARFLKTRGPGLHHIALHSNAAQADLDRLQAAGIRLIDETVRSGAEGARVGFIHPRATGGVLVEVVERGDDQAEA